ncbi:MAG: FAD-dependent oxidoreductase, partial [Pseudomonadota bacterium]
MSDAAKHERLAEGGHVVVVGAGIVGVATAIWLQRDGYRVTLVDRGAPGDGTSYGNAGVLASCSVVPVTTPGLWKKVPSLLMDPDGPLSVRWRYLPRMLPWLSAYMRNCHPERVAKTAAAMAELVSGSFEEHQALASGTEAARHIVPCDYVFAYADRGAYEGDAFGWSLRRKHGFAWEELERDAFEAYDPAMAG